MPNATGAPRHTIIAGPTASGKSALALRLAEEDGAVVVNADALQVYDCWAVLTARPDDVALTAAEHALYGHVGRRDSYSVGEWLRDVAPLIGSGRPLIFVGGSGLYLSSLTSGLATIPPIPSDVRAEGNRLRAEGGAAGLAEALRRVDSDALLALDPANPARLQRAWEVMAATGRPLREWQRQPAAPLLAESQARCIVVDPGREQLRERIAVRFDAMLAGGALDECRAALADGWDPELPSSRALGAAELVAYLRDEMPMEAAREAAIIATRQYAKRQRTWLRSRMGHWTRIGDPGALP